MPYNAITRTVNSIAELRAQRGGNGDVATRMEVLGYYTPGDGGDNIFTWYPDSTDLDDGGLTIGSWLVGRWKAKESKEIRVRTFGVVGNGIEDDTAALQAAINASANKLLDWQDVQCYTTDTIYITTPMKFTRGMALIKAGHNGIAIYAKTIQGNGVIGGDDNTAFTKGYHPDITMPVVWRWTNPQTDLKDGSTGIRLENCMNWEITVPHISGFQVGFELASNSPNRGTSYNSIYIGSLQNHINFNIAIYSGNTGYVNSNVIHGGSFSSFNQFVAEDSTHIKMTANNGLYQINHNVFIGCAMEGFHRIGVDFGPNSQLNQVLSPRLEMPYRTSYISFGSQSQGNIVRDPYGLNVDMTTYMVDTGSYNEITGYTQIYGRYYYYNGQWTFSNLNIDTTKGGIPYNADIIGEQRFVPITYSGTPITLDWKLGRKFRIAMSVATMPANSVSIINAPTNANTAVDWQMEVILIQSGTPGLIDPGWLTGIQYGIYPKPYTRPSGRDRYIIRRSYQTSTVGYHVMSHSSDNYLVSGSTGQRPTNPTTGQLFYNTQIDQLEVAYNDKTFRKVIIPKIFNAPNVGTTLTIPTDIIVLPIITASKTLTLTPSVLLAGQLLTIDNQNTSIGQSWTIAGVNMYKADGVTQITSIDNGSSYQFFFDGTNLIETTSDNIGNSYIKNGTTLQTANYSINGVGRIDGGLSIATASTPSYPLQVGTLPSTFNVSAQFIGTIIAAPAINTNEVVTRAQTLIKSATIPTSSSDTVTGDWNIDDSFLYLHAPSGWRRVALTTF